MLRAQSDDEIFGTFSSLTWEDWLPFQRVIHQAATVAAY